MKKIIACFMLFSLCGCEALQGMTNDSRSQVLGTNQSQVQQRSYQSRAFDTTDQNKTLRTVLATLQDLNFIIDKADDTLGMVSGTKYANNRITKMTVTVMPRGTKQLVVRANAQYGLQPITNPLIYQDFFQALEKSMFLTAHEVD